MTESLLYFHVVVKVDIQRIDERKEDKFDALIKDNHDIDRILGLDRTWPLTTMAIIDSFFRFFFIIRFPMSKFEK